MPKVGLKDTLTLLAKGYSKKEIDALAAADEEQDKDPEPTPAPTPAPAPEDKKDPEPTPAPKDKKDPEPDYKKMYEDLKKENDETKEKLTKLQQKNVHKDSTPDSDKQKEEQAKSLNDLVRSFM